MNKLILIIISTLCFSSFSQNNSWQYYQDSIQPLLNSNKYSEAKQKFLILNKSNIIDPDLKVFFIQYALMYDDIKFYKKEIKKILIHHGLEINYSDSLLMDERYDIYNYLKDEKIRKWSIKQSKEKYGIWLKNNQQSLKFKETIKLAKERDRLVRTISFPLYPAIQQFDSLCFNKLYETYKDIIREVDTKNCHLVEELCKLNDNYLPNNFDNGIGMFNPISLIITHNLKQGTNIEYMRINIFPFLEQAFLDRKIDMDLFYTYDIYLNKYFGYQYYGTLSENVPVLEKETFSERKSRLKF